MEAAQKLQRDRDPANMACLEAPRPPPGSKHCRICPNGPESQRLTGEKEVLAFLSHRTSAAKIRAQAARTGHRHHVPPQRAHAAVGSGFGRHHYRVADRRAARRARLRASATPRRLGRHGEFAGVSRGITAGSIRYCSQKPSCWSKGRSANRGECPAQDRGIRGGLLESVEIPMPTGGVIRVRLGDGNGGVAQQLIEIFRTKTGPVPVRWNSSGSAISRPSWNPTCAFVRTPNLFRASRRICGRDSVRLV